MEEIFRFADELGPLKLVHTHRHPSASREIAKRLRSITPVVVPYTIPYRNPDYRELFLSDLRLAAGHAA
jgi:hypothetical protein